MTDQSNPYCVFLATDREPRRRQLTHRLGNLPGWQLCGDRDTKEEVLQQISKLPGQLDQLIVDLTMEGAYRLIAHLSTRPSTPPILAIGTSSDDASRVRHSLIAGAAGYVGAKESDEVLEGAMQSLRAGNIYLSP